MKQNNYNSTEQRQQINDNRSTERLNIDYNRLPVRRRYRTEPNRTVSNVRSFWQLHVHLLCSRTDAPPWVTVFLPTRETSQLMVKEM